MVMFVGFSSFIVFNISIFFNLPGVSTAYKFTIPAAVFFLHIFQIINLLWGRSLCSCATFESLLNVFSLLIVGNYG